MKKWGRQLLAAVFSMCFAHATFAESANKLPTILVFGDSLSAAFKMAESDGWVNLLANRIKAHKLAYQVANESVSGETTGGGLRRFADALKKHQPSIVIVELGTNDGLRGLPLSDMQSNLANMITASQQAGAQVLLLGTKVPPQYGADYSTAFENSYLDIAHQNKTALVPLFLTGIAEKPELLQDGLHPKASTQPMILDNIWPTLKPMLNTPDVQAP